jgi:hypothetical protein
LNKDGYAFIEEYFGKRIKEVFEKHPFGYKNHAQIWYKGGRGVRGKCLGMRVMRPQN